MKIWFIFISLFFLNSYLNAAVGCMDYSKHTCTVDGYDYKNLHYVYCTCPCEKYVYMDGRCSICTHYHVPKAVRYIY